ncbi:MAG: TonB-dependent receptor, partial [Gemmatimonadetes bacterium]|nr:TonB-dependent receptor [Gemmatimonadota bacterium]
GGVRGGRTDGRGVARVRAQPGDTVVVTAVGYRPRRQAVDGGTLTVWVEPLPAVLPAVITTAGQRELRGGESTRATLALDREAIDAAAAIAVNQLLRQQPGIQEIPAVPARSTLAIRGMDDARVLVLVDGEPMAGALVEARDIGRLSTLAAGRIEVTKGPSGVEFGSDAIGGVVNLVSAPPTATPELSWLARQGGLGRRESTLVGAGARGRVGARLSGGWREADRLAGYGAAGSTMQRVYDLRSDVRVALPGAWQLRLDLQGSRERQRFPLDARLNGFIDNLGGQGFVEGSGPLLGGTGRVRASAQAFRYQYRQARGLLPIRASADSLEQREGQQRLLAAWSRSAGGHVLDAGGLHVRRALVAPEKLDGTRGSDVLTEGWLRDAYATGRWLLSAGARVTRSALWGSTWNPSVGAAWHPHPALRLRGNVARGFRAPGFKEVRYQFTNPVAGYALAGNPGLRPERSWSTGVGATWAPASAWSADVEWYRNDVDQLVEWRFVGTTVAGLQGYQLVNVAHARTQGVEAQVRWHPGITSVMLGWDLLHARDMGTGLPLSRRSPQMVRLMADRPWGRRQWVQTDAQVRYTAAAPLVGIPSGAPLTGPFSTAAGIIGWQGAWLAVDAQARFTVWKGAVLSLGGNNLLGQRPAFWSPAIDRQWYAGVDWHWRGTPTTAPALAR